MSNASSGSAPLSLVTGAELELGGEVVVAAAVVVVGAAVVVAAAVVIEVPTTAVVGVPATVGADPPPHALTKTSVAAIERWHQDINRKSRLRLDQIGVFTVSGSRLF
jgi:hypothetical protein